MDPDTDKIDDAVSALLYWTGFRNGGGEFSYTRAWNGHKRNALAGTFYKNFFARSIGGGGHGYERPFRSGPFYLFGP